MKLKFGIVFACIALLMSFGSSHAVDCKKNSVQTNRDVGMYISDFAVSLGQSSCPTDRLDTNNPIIALGARVQFWFRLQGSSAYLQTGVSRQPFDVRFFKKAGNTRVFFDVIEVAAINPQRVASEIAANKGRFDWRIYVRKRVFFTPGTYVLMVSQGNKNICFEQQNGQLACEQEFKVAS
ncbi:MAG: hypothetical protein COA52_04480 [Hyphomicrobiales bacterium]|nr:hypothetical protein [Hyphomicrobiales bacterium]PCJ94674.1 MAG: hypothetical protein COA52_04480 [Hyphomicrobiales bacterium]